jgi:hypothetical protein
VELYSWTSARPPGERAPNQRRKAGRGAGRRAFGENPARMSVDEFVRLYRLPLEEFTRARDQAERELRRAGEREQADQVKALRKPTAAAGAVNQLVRGHRGQVEAFLRAAARLRDAQVAGKGDIAVDERAEREALEKLVALGGDQVRAALQAAAVDDHSARELLEARLVREPEPAGFGTLLTYATPAAAKVPAAKVATAKAAAAPTPVAARPSAAKATPAKRAAAPPPRPDHHAAPTWLREARKMLKAATEEERQARRRWTQSQRQLEKARSAVENAQRELDRLHGR